MTNIGNSKLTMEKLNCKTPIFQIDNHLWIKREDLIPFSFGGNKARKAQLFFEDFDNGNYDCIVTYGSSSSNHCRIIANIAASRGIPCYIISPLENYVRTSNSQLIRLLGAEIETVPVECVHQTITHKLVGLKKRGFKPYFIQGGGHGNLGTKAYIQCYDEIVEWEKENGVFFDYIFFASGTGTTQAGLICGQIIHNDKRKIVGISVARKNPRGKQVIVDSIKEYLGELDDAEKNVIFIDDFIGEGYGKSNSGVAKTIKDVFVKYGLPLDKTYTGKAFFGMMEYLREHNISKKNILFIHTGGTPLFFDSLNDLETML